MSEKPKNIEFYIRGLAVEMYTECESNKDLYGDGSDVFETHINGNDWRVMYWPDTLKEGRASLILACREDIDEQATIYGVEYCGGITKSRLVKDHKTQREKLIDWPLFDPSEAEMLRSVLRTVHEEQRENSAA